LRQCAVLAGLMGIGAGDQGGHAVSSKGADALY
jgi:hypothetical protein